MNLIYKVIGHFDADCFFASVELLKYPHLKGKPVMVCSRTDNRGIVVSASYEARPFGIRAGTPVFQAKQKCPQGILLNGHFSEYAAFSKQFIKILQSFSPEVESYSIDEAFVDLTGLETMYGTDFESLGRRIQSTIYKALGITFSVGIAPNRLLAKIASDASKPGGLTVVTEEKRPEFLKSVPIKAISGIGWRTEKVLKGYDFFTAWDMVQPQALELLKTVLGKRGVDLHSALLGESHEHLSTHNALPKSLSNTRTFPDFSSNKGYIYTFSLELLISLARRLRHFGLETSYISFFLLTKNFKSLGIKKTLAYTDDENELIAYFKEFFKSIFKEGIIYRKSGFFMSSFRLKALKQSSLFETSKYEISPVLDRLNAKFGARSVIRASLLPKTPFFSKDKEKIPH